MVFSIYTKEIIKVKSAMAGILPSHMEGARVIVSPDFFLFTKPIII